MDNIVFGIGITALAGALATVAGAAENTESDIGSQGDPNSQVQLAPQMGYLHRIFNGGSGLPLGPGFPGLSWQCRSTRSLQSFSGVSWRLSFRGFMQPRHIWAGLQVSQSLDSRSLSIY